MLIHPRTRCPRTFLLGWCVPLMMFPLDDVFPSDLSLTGKRGRGCRVWWVKKVSANSCCDYPEPALQRHFTENSKRIFPEMKLRGLSPNCYIHVSVSDLYIPRLVCLFCCRKLVEQSWECINRSEKYECGNWNWSRAVLFWRDINRIFFAVCNVYAVQGRYISVRDASSKRRIGKMSGDTSVRDTSSWHPTGQ